MRIYKTYQYIIVLFAFVIQNVSAETKDQRIKVALRTICHEFLLQLDDSTSRILPIDKIDGRYVVTFENEFAFEPDLLLYSVFKIYDEKAIYEDFIVEVEKCDTQELVHSFQASHLQNKSMRPCRMRGLPKDCYVFYFTEVVNLFPQEEPTKSLVEEKGNPTQKGESSIYLYSLLSIVIGTSGFFMFRRTKDEKAEEHHEEAETSDLIRIGQYQFDAKAMVLNIDGHSIELSVKETDLLTLLCANENKTLEREYILNQVWKDEGSYVGRTLDVFISKLRKKLEQDPKVKIMNVRGVGYKFIIN